MTTQAIPELAFQLASNYYLHLGTAAYRDFPVRVSVPVAPGRCPPDEPMAVYDDTGRARAACVRPLLSWPDGSVRVWEVFLPATLKKKETKRFLLGPAASAAPPPARPDAFLRQPDRFSIDVVLTDGTKLYGEVQLDLPAATSSPSICDEEKEFELAASGTPAFKGTLVRRLWSWYPATELQVRVINFSRDDVTPVRSVRLAFDLPGGEATRYCIKQACIMVGKPRLVEAPSPFTVRADEAAIHVTDPTQLGEDESSYPPYERGTYLGMVDPWLAAADAEAAWVLALPDAAERRPKGWSIDRRAVTVDLHPDWAPPLLWRQGMAVFQRLHLARLPATASAADCENEAQAWLRPPIVRLDPDLYRAAGWRIPFHYEPARFPKTEFEFRDSFDFTWPRGTFDWGDGDWSGRRKRNLEYDFVGVAAREYARTGRQQLLKLCRSAAEHSMYTDFVAFSSDPWKEGGIAAHCIDHTTGAAYPSHMWAEGLTQYYQLTGDRYALRVAMRVGDFFLTYIRERFCVVNATAREGGWTLIALGALYDLTRERRYLDGIRTVVDHVIAQQPEAFFPEDATFAVGVAIIGLDRVRAFHRDADVQRFILALLDHLIAHRCDAIGLFDYNHDQERDYLAYVQTHLPEALNIGYRLSGDERYLRAAWRQYMIHQAGGQLTVQQRYAAPECGYAAGNHISWIGCLQSFAEKGWLDRIQYAEPSP